MSTYTVSFYVAAIPTVLCLSVFTLNFLLAVWFYESNTMPEERIYEDVVTNYMWLSSGSLTMAFWLMSTAYPTGFYPLLTTAVSLCLFGLTGWSWWRLKKYTGVGVH